MPEEWAERPDFGEMEAERYEDSVRRSAVGFKAPKPLGLRARDPRGKLVPVDDSRLDPLWAMAGKTDTAVIVQVADPIAFFDPFDEHNERWGELSAHPDWHFWPPRSEAAEEGFPGFDEISMPSSEWWHGTPKRRSSIATSRRCAQEGIRRQRTQDAAPGSLIGASRPEPQLLVRCPAGVR